MPQYIEDNILSLDDAQLTTLIKDGNNYAFEIITSRYYKLIASISMKYRNSEYDTDDFIQEGLLGLLSACKSYDMNKDISFRNYAMICIENRFKSIFRSLNKKKTIPNSSIVSINEDITSSSDNTKASLQEQLESKEYIHSLYKALEEKLSKLEYSIVKLYLSGMSYDEIALKLNIEKKSVDNALSRVHKKLSR